MTQSNQGGLERVDNIKIKETKYIMNKKYTA